MYSIEIIPTWPENRIYQEVTCHSKSYLDWILERVRRMLLEDSSEEGIIIIRKIESYDL